MPDITVFAFVGRWRGPILLTAQFLFWLASGEAAGAAPDKVYFFATKGACVASGAFAKEECASAFENASAQLRDRSPRFPSGDDCRARFHLCELRRHAFDGESLADAEPEAVVYSPVALGVEMVVTAQGVEAAPTLAVETQLFPRFPISRRYGEDMPQPAAKPLFSSNVAILAADRFQPFPKPGAREVEDFAAEPETTRPPATGAVAEASQASSSEETPAERRARLRNAPLVQ
jgi:hypothetical protein